MTTRRQALRQIALSASMTGVGIASGAATRRMGILSEAAAPPGGIFVWESDFWGGMAQRGWIVGQNILVERAFANGRSDRLPELAEELVRKQVDVIFCWGEQEAMVAAARATRTIPIVAFDAYDPIEQGLVQSLGRPGRNVTGFALSAGRGFPLKRLQFLRAIAPSARRLCWLWGSDTLMRSRVDGTRLDYSAWLAAAAKDLDFEARFYRVTSLSDLAKAFADASTWRPQALTAGNRVLSAVAREVAEFSLSQRLPSCFNSPEYVHVGGLLSYSIPASEAQSVMTRGIAYVDRILRGEKPADMPVIGPDRYELTINLKTAETLGLVIPQSVLVLADEVVR